MKKKKRLKKEIYLLKNVKLKKSKSCYLLSKDDQETSKVNGYVWVKVRKKKEKSNSSLWKLFLLISKFF